MMMAIRTWREMFRALKKHPKILIPFLVAGVANGLALYFLYLAPQRPVSFILAPPIRRFFGEQFLHYPYHLFLLPKLALYAQIVLSASVGILMSGLAIGMLKEAMVLKRPKVLRNFVLSLRRYLTLMGIWLVMFGMSFLAQRGMQFVETAKYSSLVSSFTTYLVVVLTHVFFIYAMPAVIIEGKRLFPAFKRSFLFFIKSFFPTILMVIVPAMFYFPVIMANHKVPFLINRFFPEIVLFVLGAGVVVTMVIDIFFTAAPTLAFLKKRGGAESS